VASGDKVVDDGKRPFFREATSGMEEIHAVEMESAGAGVAVRFRQTMGVLRFLMIKGISDQPTAGPGVDRGSTERTLSDRRLNSSRAIRLSAAARKLPES
jgi:nucleoside phosphorylase